MHCPEALIRHELHRHGLRFRMNSQLLRRPDVPRCVLEAMTSRSSDLQVAYRAAGLVIVFVECVCEHLDERQVRPWLASCSR
jgi:hypothetical protein